MNSAQKCILLNPEFGEIISIAISGDESRIIYSQVSGEKSSLQMVMLNKSEKPVIIEHQHNAKIHSLDWSRDNRKRLKIKKSILEINNFL